MGLMGCMFLLLSLLTGLRALGHIGYETVSLSSFKNRPVPGHPENISTNDKGLRKAILFGTYAFNNQSNDAFLFRPSVIKDAQRQIVKGIRYIADVEISRTVCRKKEHEDLVSCDFQPDGLLQQTFVCHFEMWALPWLHSMKTIYFMCHLGEKQSCSSVSPKGAIHTSHHFNKM